MIQPNAVLLGAIQEVICKYMIFICFLGKAQARAPINRFFCLPACLYVHDC